MIFEKKNLFWIREADQSEVTDDRIIIYTQPKTDLWQRTYYGFQNDSAPVLQMKTSEKYFSFIVKTEFDTKARFDQCINICRCPVRIPMVCNNTAKPLVLLIFIFNGCFYPIFTILIHYNTALVKSGLAVKFCFYNERKILF